MGSSPLGVVGRAEQVEAESRQRGAEIRQLASTGGVNLVGVVAGGVLNLAFTVLVTRGFGLARAGLVLEGISLYSIVSAIATLGGDTGLLRELPRLLAGHERGALRPTLVAALLPVVGVSAVLATGGLIWAATLARLVNHGGPVTAEQVRYLRFIAGSLFLAAPSLVSLAAIRSLGRQRSYVLLENITKPVLRALGAALVVSLGAGEAALGLSYVLPVGVGLLGSALVLRGLLASDPPPASRPCLPAVLRRFWSFASPRGCAAIFAVVVAYVDILLVGALRGSREATIYAAVSRYVLTGTFGLHAVRVAIGPQFSRLLSQRRHRDAEHVYQTSTAWLILLAWPFYLLLATYPALLLRLFGSKYSVGATALTLLCLAELVDMGVGNVTLYLLMGGKSSWNLLNTGVSLALNVALNLFLIPRVGFLGAAIAWSVSIVVENLLALVEVRLLLGVRPFGANWLPAAGLALGCFGLLPLAGRLMLGSLSGVGLMISVGVATALYGAAIHHWRGLLQIDQLTAGSRRYPGGYPPHLTAVLSNSKSSSHRR